LTFPRQLAVPLPVATVVWVPAKVAGGARCRSTNPIVDQHIVGIFSLIVVATARRMGGRVPRPEVGILAVVQSEPWLH
jgi:hypothetical protein